MFSGQDSTFSYTNCIYYTDSTAVHPMNSSFCSSGFFSDTETNDISISSQQYQKTLAYEELDQNETDDLLYQFGNYFREKLNKEVKNFCSSMSSMFDEQQIHVKQIINAARNHEMKQHSVLGISSSTEEDDIQAIGELHPKSNESEEKTCKESKERFIIRLLTLSSMISSNLH